MRDTYEKKWQAKRREVGYDPDEHDEYNTYAMGKDLNGIIDFEKLMEINIFENGIN